MDVEQMKREVADGTIRIERLVAVIISLQKKVDKAEQRADKAEERVRELEKKLGQRPAERFDEPFSVKSEEQRQTARGRRGRKNKKPKGRRGRRKTTEKLKAAQRHEDVFPGDVDPHQCWLSHSRPVWRLEDGRAVLVAYHIYRGPGNRYGRIPGVLGRSEFGLEIVVSIAYQVNVVGLSFDKVCLLMDFFESLPLRKSQVDSLLNQLWRHWESEFDGLCMLLANSAIVHADETSWSINSVWAFLSEKVRLLFFGVHKDAATLQEILDPATFAGLMVSDDAAVYANFTQAQKCWAHLLRKSIKLTLLDRSNAEYRRLADGLLDIYHAACRVQRDGRLGDAGRARKVAELEDRIFDLCYAVWAAELPVLEGPDNDYRLLCNELMRLMLAEQLFTFVTAAPIQAPDGQTMAAPGTNNEAERSLRDAAQARKIGRTSKTLAGARRQTVLTSMLESLRLHLPEFTLSSVIAEILRWSQTGCSRFAELVAKLDLPPPDGSILDRVLPLPQP
jgi:hypothetical protein